MGKTAHTACGALIAFLISLPVCGRTIDVGPNRACTSIARALALARDGDVIKVYSGKVYHERIKITRRITLQGVGFPVIDGDRKGNVVEVKADGVAVEGLKIINSARSSNIDFCGLHGQNVHGVTVRNCVFRANQFSLMLQNASDCTVSRNDISSDITFNPLMGNAIHCWKSTGMNIVDNKIGHNRDGIYLEFVDHSHIARNRISGCDRYGLHFMFSHYNVYEQNHFSHNKAGVAVMFAHHVTMLDNIFELNEGTSSYGLLIKELQYSHIMRNKFRRNTVGLMIDGGSDLAVSHNEIRDNGWGIRLISASNNDTIRANNFRGNTFDLTTNVSYNHNFVDGNYWDNYEGYDLNRDGTGDVPYHPLSLFSMLAESNDTVLLFFRSFLMNLLDATEKLLPTITPDNYVDHTPSMNPFTV